MQAKHKNILLKLVLFAVVFSLMLVSVSAASDTTNKIISDQGLPTYDISDLPATCPSSFTTDAFKFIGAHSETQQNYLTYNLCRQGSSPGVTCSATGLPLETPFLSAFVQFSATDSGCWPSGQIRLKDKHQMGVALGGYLFVHQNSAPFKTSVRAGQRRDTANSFAHSLIFNISDQGEVNLDDAPRNYFPNFAYIGSDGSKDWDQSAVSTKSVSLPIGVYYYIIIIDHYGETRGRAGDRDDEETTVNIGSATPSNIKTSNSFTSNSYWDIKHDLPPANEIYSMYNSEVEFDDYEQYCTLSGFPYGPSEDGVGNFCCGDDTGTYPNGDDGQVHEPTGFICQQLDDGTWEFSGAEERCINEFAGTWNDQLASYDYGATDGSDGCCGDDPDDYGYYGDQWFCNADSDENDETITPGFEGDNKWWDAQDPNFEYMIHTVNGIDYINNKDEWYECRPTDEDNTNNLIGTGEELPVVATLDTSSCSGALNTLVESGFFNEYMSSNGIGELIFETSLPENDALQLNGTCTSETVVGEGSNTIIQDNFFDIDAPVNCLTRCFLGGSGTQLVGAIGYDSGIDDASCNFLGSCSGGSNGVDELDFNTCSEDNSFCLADSHPTIPCANYDISEHNFNGTLCNLNTSFCSTDLFAHSSDDAPVDNLVCCISNDPTAELCIEQEEVPTQTSCEAFEGEWIAATIDDLGNYECDSLSGFSVGENGACCYAGTWTLSTSVQNSNDYSQAFMCVDKFEENRFVECCGSNFDNCANLGVNPNDNPLYSPDQSTGTFVTSGGSSYLVENKDAYISGYLSNGVHQISPSLGVPRTIFLPQSVRTRTDWSEFETVQFDIVYALDAPHTLSVYDIFDNEVFSGLLSNYLVDGTGKVEIHHAIISLLDFSSTSNISRFVFSTTNEAPVDMIVDNIFLTKATNDHYFCSGDYKQWVKNLDGDTLPNPDDGFPISAGLSDYSAYKHACNSVRSFGWTGRLCCGDDTTLSSAETFVDENAGCFLGNKIKVNNIVGETLHNQEFDDLIYFSDNDGKKFYQCTPDGIATHNYPGTHGNYGAANVVEAKTVGEGVGSYSCVEDEGNYIWKYDAQRSCEYEGFDYLSQDELTLSVLTAGAYNEEPENRCCARDVVTAGTSNGDFKCTITAGNSGLEYEWKSNLGDEGGFCNTFFQGSVLPEFDAYGINANQACCYDDTIGEIATLDGNDVFICLKDQKPDESDSTTSTHIVTLRDDTTTFKWWDARSNLYKVHSTFGEDIISTGDSWLSCGIDVPYGDPLPESSTPTCIDMLNDPLVKSAFGVNDTTEFGVCTGTNEYCCESDYEYERGHFFSTEYEAETLEPPIYTQCDIGCYLAEDQTIFTNRSSTANNPDPNELFCEFYPDEQYCLGIIPINENNNDDGETINPPELCSSYGVDGVSDTCSLSGANTVCTKTSVNSFETYLDNNDGVCCVGSSDDTLNSLCQPQPAEDTITSEICDEYHGDWKEELTAQYTCSSGIFSGNCCFNVATNKDGWVTTYEELSDVIQINNNEGFICHDRGNQQWFSECCAGPDCKGLEERALFNNVENSADAPYNGISGVGDNIGTIESFNLYQATGHVEKDDLQYISASSPVEIIFENNQQRNVGDFSNANNLFFDIYYHHDVITKVVLIDLFGEELEFNFNENQVISKGTDKWNKVQIDLNSPISINNEFNNSAVHKLELRTNFIAPVQTKIDNIWIDNTLVAYCTGEFHEWIDDLDAPGLVDITDPVEQLIQTIKYETTCNSASRAYGWSGTLCCGDDTTLSGQEYYVEETDACFAGNKIEHATIVGEELDNELENHYLFYDGEFHRCNGENSQSRPTLYMATYGEQDSPSTELADNLYEPFETVGNFLCGIDGDWIGLERASSTKLLAAKIFDLVKGDDAYSIHCENIDNVTPNTVNFDDSIETFCAGQTYDNSDDHNTTIVGFVVDSETPIEDFLYSYGTYLHSISLLDENEIEDFSIACNTVTEDEVNFFTSCDSQPSRIRITYNKDYNVILITQLSSGFNAVFTDFQGVFASDSGFDSILEIIYRFTQVFTNWFVEDNNDAPDNRLPQIVVDSDNLDLNRLVIKGQKIPNTNDYKTIAGYVQYDEDNNYDHVAVEYAKFVSSVQPIIYPFYGEENDFNYQKGINRQVIQFDATQALGFESAFDWRLFTSALRLDANFEGDYLSAQPGDGILDIGEECDVISLIEINDSGDEVVIEQPVFINGAVTCADWNPDAYLGTLVEDELLLCFTSSGTVNLANCAYCGDGINQVDEQCDDGNNDDGDGCTTMCILETCGDGILNNNDEVCDDGNNDEEAYNIANAQNFCNADCSAPIPYLGDGICQEEHGEACVNNPFEAGHVDCGYCDADGDGYTISQEYYGTQSDWTSCDNDATINPGIEEQCDHIDNNCNGVEDEGVTIDYYVDGDGDTFGNQSEVMPICLGDDETGLSNNTIDFDCNDADPITYPGADEVCTDTADYNCDGIIGSGDLFTFYVDADGDGHGMPDSVENPTIEACEEPLGYSFDNAGDCNDTDDTIYQETVVCKDRDQDGYTGFDEVQWTICVGDTFNYPTYAGFGGSILQSVTCEQPFDCRSSNSQVHPGATEITCNDIDDDCNSSTPDNDGSCSTCGNNIVEDGETCDNNELWCANCDDLCSWSVDFYHDFAECYQDHHLDGQCFDCLDDIPNGCFAYYPNTNGNFC